ncbi:hypothetical protein C8Q80DRAFT_579524 [Daedaleopsis nitida]|nr:hypothetical protein C8Q80DRAFT_579524 [Daedaleopsis nitida]
MVLVYCSIHYQCKYSGKQLNLRRMLVSLLSRYLSRGPRKGLRQDGHHGPPSLGTYLLWPLERLHGHLDDSRDCLVPTPTRYKGKDRQNYPGPRIRRRRSNEAEQTSWGALDDARPFGALQRGQAHARKHTRVDALADACPFGAILFGDEVTLHTRRRDKRQDSKALVDERPFGAYSSAMLSTETLNGICTLEDHCPFGAQLVSAEYDKCRHHTLHACGPPPVWGSTLRCRQKIARPPGRIKEAAAAHLRTFARLELYSSVPSREPTRQDLRKIM